MNTILASTIGRLSALPIGYLVLWCGLVALTLVLCVLVATRWGKSHPVATCGVLSLLAHVLLACVATIVRLVAAADQVAEGPPIRVRIVDVELPGTVDSPPPLLPANDPQPVVNDEAPATEPTPSAETTAEKTVEEPTPEFPAESEIPPAPLATIAEQFPELPDVAAQEPMPKRESIDQSTSDPPLEVTAGPEPADSVSSRVAVRLRAPAPGCSPTCGCWESRSTRARPSSRTRRRRVRRREFRLWA